MQRLQLLSRPVNVVAKVSSQIPYGAANENSKPDYVYSMYMYCAQTDTSPSAARGPKTAPAASRSLTRHAYSAFSSFFPKLCLILKNRFLA